MYRHLFHVGLLCYVATISYAQTGCTPSPRKGIIDGDINIGFIFPFAGPSNDGRGCNTTVPSPDNIQLIEAAIHVVQSINSGQILPGISLGLEAWDCCHLSNVAVERSVAYLNEKVSSTSNDGTPCSSTSLLAGVVGLSDNDVADAVASVLNEAKMPLVSYGASSSNLPMYNNFLSTVPSDSMDVEVIVKLLVDLKMTYVYTFTSADESNKAATEHFKMLATRSGICVSDSKTLLTNSTASVYNSTISSFTAGVDNPNVVVLFTSTEDAMNLFKAAQYSSKDLQWVIGRQVLTDSIGLQEETIKVTRGLIGVVPSILSYKVEAFLSSFTGTSSLDNQADPWFVDYNQEQADTIQNAFVAPLQNAFMVYATALHNAQADKCSSTGLCDALRKISPEELIGYLTNSTFIGVDGTNVTYSSSRQLMMSSYSIVNIGRNSDYNYVLNMVGNFTDNKLSLSKDAIQFWVDGQIVGASVVNSTCSSPCSDLACGEMEDLTKVYIPGNIIIGGMFGVHQNAPYPSSSGCGNISDDGIQQLEALLYALDLLNNDSSVLPDLKVGIDAFDTCNSASRAGSQAIKLVGGAEFGGTGSGQRTDQSGNVEHIYGIVGPGSDDECKEVLNVIGVYDVPDITYSAQSASLSNTYNYPTFARTVSVETVPVAVIIEILVAKGWKYVQAIITPNSYGWNSYSVLTQQAPPKGICVTQRQMPYAGSSMDALIEDVTKGNAANVTILFTEQSDTYRFLKEITARNLNGRFYIIAATKWSLNNVTDDIKNGLKGLTVVNIRERNVTGFKNYYSKLKPSTNLRNPWFQEYWANTFSCTFKNNTCNDQMSLKTDDVTNPYVGEVIDSVYAMAKAIDTLHRAKCPLQTSVCYDMTVASGSELFLNLRNVNFESKNDDKKIISFNYQGDGSSDFEVFNYQESGTTFEYVKIGSYSLSKLELNADMLKHYDQQGQVAQNDGNACVGTCDSCKAVTKEKVAEVKNGDVWIGGFFELNQPGNDRINCLNKLLQYNMQHLEAFMWAIDELNKDQTILPDMDIGAISFDTCGLPEKARREVTNYVSKAVEYRSGYPKDSVRVLGIIGGETSDSSVEIADVITPLGISQISYAATSEVLNNVPEYPYFLRTVPTDSDQALALVDIIANFGWSYVSVVFSEDGYGNDILREFSKIAQKSNICIAMKLKIQLNSTNADFDQNVRTLLSNPSSLVAVLLTSDIDTKQLLQAAERRNVSSIQWLGTDTWGSRRFVTDDAKNTSRRAITLRFQQTTAIGFKEYFTKLNPYYNTRNPWFSEYWMDTFKCNLNVWNVPLKYNTLCPWAQSLEDVYKEETEVTYIANAVKAFAIGLNKTIQAVCPNITNYVCEEVYNNSKLLNENIRSAKFIGFEGKMFSFDAEGNGPPKYDILNFVDNVYSTIGTWNNGSLTWNGTEWKTQIDKVTSECVGRCTECGVDDDIKMASVPGELQIPAFFAIHDHGDYTNDCGLLRDTGIVNLEAFLFALDEINNSTTLLPGVRLGTNAFDSCMTSSRAVREASSLLGGILDVGSNSWSSVVGIVGSETDDTTESLAAVSEQYKYTQISYGASSSVFDDLDVYPYLLRTLSSSSVSMQVVVDVIKYFNWDGVFVVYSDTAENKTNLDVFTKASEKVGICIQQTLMVPRDATDEKYQNILTAIEAPDTPSVVVLLTTLSDASSIQHQATKMERHVTWVETGGLGRKPPVKTDVTGAVSGSFYVVPSRPTSVKSFADYFNNLVQGNNRNPWFSEYIGTGSCPAGAGCTSPRQLLNEENQLMAGVIIDSVYAIANGMNTLLTSTCSGPGVCADFLSFEPDHLFKAIQEATFKDTIGGTLQFTDGGYAMRDFDVYNYQYDNGPNSYVNVGTWSSTNQLDLQLFELYDENGKSTDSIVSKCKERSLTTNQPNTTNGPTTKEIEKSANSGTLISEKSITGDVYSVILFLCIVGIVATLAIMLFFFRKRNTSLVTTYSFGLCMLLLTSILALYVMPLLFGLEPSNTICAIQHLVIGLAYAARTSSALLMSIRLYRIGKHERRISGETTTHTDDTSQLVFFTCLMFVELMLIAEWVVIEPLEKLYKDGPDESLQCFYDMDGLAVSFVYVFVMLLATLGLTVWARMKVDLSYHPQVIGVMIATVGTIVAFVVWIIAAVLTNKEEDIPIFISFGTIVTATINLLVIFPPKIVNIYRRYDPKFDDTVSILSRSSTGINTRYVEPTSTSASNVVVENPAAMGDEDDSEVEISANTKC